MAGALQARLTWPLPAVAELSVGAPGTVALPLATVTDTDEVAVLPARSVAIAALVWLRLAAVVLDDEAVKGLVVSVALTIESTLKSTLAMPWPSDASADSASVPATVAPDAGAVSETVGGTVSM